MPRFPFAVAVRRRAPIACSLILACGLLAACGAGKDAERAPTGTPIPTATVILTPTALAGPPRIGSVVWSVAVDPRTSAPVDAATPVVTDNTIYAAVPIESLPAGSQLLARWYFNDTSLDALDSSLRIDQDRTSGWVEFHIERTGADPWPDGDYEIVISDGTHELGRSVISIS